MDWKLQGEVMKGNLVWMLLGVSILFSLGLGLMLWQMNIQNEVLAFQQKQIDIDFNYHISQLHTDLFNKLQIPEVQEDIIKEAAKVEVLLRFTSYTDIDYMENIALKLIKISKEPASYHLEETLIHEMTYMFMVLNQHPEDISQLSSSVWKKLSKVEKSHSLK